MPLPTCPICTGGDLDGVEKLPDGRLVVRCLDCDHEWVRGEGRPVAPVRIAATYESLKVSFPTTDAVRPEIRNRVASLNRDLRAAAPGPRPAGSAVPGEIPGP